MFPCRCAGTLSSLHQCARCRVCLPNCLTTTPKTSSSVCSCSRLTPEGGPGLKRTPMQSSIVHLVDLQSCSFSITVRAGIGGCQILTITE